MSDSDESSNRLAFWEEKRHAAFFELMKQGHSVADAARILQCHRSTIYKEAKRDPAFAEALRQSKRAAAARGPLQTIQHAAADNWKAAAWWLERVEPEKYGRAGVAGPREIAQFMDDLYEAIEDIVDDDQEPRRLYRRLVAAMPAPFRRAWDRKLCRRLARQLPPGEAESDATDEDGPNDEWEDNEDEAGDDELLNCDSPLLESTHQNGLEVAPATVDSPPSTQGVDDRGTIGSPVPHSIDCLPTSCGD
jgi:hypothetical protein